ncbi:MAG: class I SAM-dependent methyltransferase [Bernardetiaceae bacterium]
MQYIDNIKCYAPELAHANADYPVEAFEELYKIETENFWFFSRNAVLQHLFKKYLGTDQKHILEIGCGTGFVLHGLSQKFPNYVLSGSEIHVAGIHFAQKRLPEVEFVQLDATRMPFTDTFDAVGAFDVLEHIEEDVQVMKEVQKSLKKEGLFFISVPQYQWMWSIADDVAYHKRRYTRQMLGTRLREAGFEVLYMGSFVATLFPLMYASRLLKRRHTGKLTEAEARALSMQELQLSPTLNAILRQLMRIDEGLIKKNVSLPFGGSLLAVARKK